jgi:hypothetical protein
MLTIQQILSHGLISLYDPGLDIYVVSTNNNHTMFIGRDNGLYTQGSSVYLTQGVVWAEQIAGDAMSFFDLLVKFSAHHNH